MKTKHMVDLRMYTYTIECCYFHIWAFVNHVLT